MAILRLYVCPVFLSFGVGFDMFIERGLVRTDLGGEAGLTIVRRRYVLFFGVTITCVAHFGVEDDRMWLSLPHKLFYDLPSLQRSFVSTPSPSHPFTEYYL